MPLFDPGFSADSYGFRPGRNAHEAARWVQSILKEGCRFTVDVDLSKFFDRVNHDLLMTHLGRKVRDKRLLALIARYADDFTIVVNSRRAGVRVLTNRNWGVSMHYQLFRIRQACGITSKGPWRSSKTPGIQQTLSNDFLKAEGLVLLRDGWIKLHHSR